MMRIRAVVTSVIVLLAPLHTVSEEGACTIDAAIRPAQPERAIFLIRFSQPLVPS